MIIHPPELEQVDDRVRISSHIEFSSPQQDFPQQLWFEFPQEYAHMLTARADPFLVALLLLAMSRGEHIDVRAPISPKLAYGIQEYMRIQHSWNPSNFALINIQTPELSSPPTPQSPAAVAASFSGGVDSFHTLWSHLPQNQSLPAAALTHALFVHGFDIPLSSREDYRRTHTGFTEFFQRLHIPLIPAAFNLRQFSEFNVDWYYMHAPGLISLPLALGDGLSRFYVASGSDYRKLPPGGISPLSDHLLSTERLAIVNHGSAVTRTEKVRRLNNFPQAAHLLRVCRHPAKRPGLHNCSRCEKCLRTTIVLHLLGELPHYATFNKASISPLDILRWGRFYMPEFPFGREVIGLARQKNQYHLIPFVWIIILFSHLRKFLLKTIPPALQNPIKRLLKSPGPDPRHLAPSIEDPPLLKE